MIEITPKALRFARLAAERQIAFRADPLVETLLWKEASVESRPHEVRRRVELSVDAALFCLRAVEALLARPELFSTDEWDGNDYAFLQAFARSLEQQLSAVRVPLTS